MMTCPISGLKMKPARAANGWLWYCPESRSRVVTVAMAKHFLGAPGVQELWMRAQLPSVAHTSSYRCPSCSRAMRTVELPGWVGAGVANVCLPCQLFWFQPDTQSKVPRPEDLIVPGGDATLIKDRAMGLLAIEKVKAENEERRTELLGDGPDSVLASLPGFLGLPVEMSDRGGFLVAVLTWLVMAVCFLIYFFAGTSPVEAWGFYPARPLEHGGLNFLTSTFLHGDWFHLIFNLYFFFMFSDDIEATFGHVRYVLLFIVSAIGANVGAIVLSTRPEVPHVGLSGVVMAMLAVYGLAFPKSRVAYIFPGMHMLKTVTGRYARVETYQWIRVPVWAVFVFYAAAEGLKYYIFERGGATSTSHASHLGGLGIGALAWFLFLKPRQKALAVATPMAAKTMGQRAKRQ